MNIDIKKFASISFIDIEKMQEEDIKKGILDILNYISVLENSAEINTGIEYDQRKLNIFRSLDMSMEQTQNDRRDIILQNAPLSTENYFNVPALIVRKS